MNNMEEEIDVLESHQSSMKYRCLKACWAVLVPTIVMLGVILGVIVIIGLVGGWIACLVLYKLYPDNGLFGWLIISPLIVILIILILILIGMIIFAIGIGIHISYLCVKKIVIYGLSKIDELEQQSNQVEVHEEIKEDIELANVV